MRIGATNRIGEDAGDVTQPDAQFVSGSDGYNSAGMPIIPPPASEIVGSTITYGAVLCTPGQTWDAVNSKCQSPLPWWLIALGLGVVGLAAIKGGKK